MKEVTDAAILNQLNGKEVTDPAIIAQLEEKSKKPSLSLGNKVISEIEGAFQLPFKGTMDMANTVASGVLYPVSKLANWGTAGYGKITGDPNWKENAYQAEQTVQGLNPIPTGQEAFGGEPSALQQGMELLSYTQKPAELVKKNLGYVPGEIAEQFTNYLLGRPMLKSKARPAPGTPTQMLARTVAEENKLPTLPTTVSDSFLAKKTEKIIGPFKNTISPVFEKVRDFINTKVDESNTKIKSVVDNITAEFKTTDEQVAFLGNKGAVYDSVLAQLPQNFEMPKLEMWLGKQIAKINEIEKKRGLNKKELEVRDFYNFLYETPFGPSTISRINGANPMTKNAKISAKWRMHDDLKMVEGGEAVAEALKTTNKEYNLTSRSGVITNFLEKVTDKDGNIDMNKWDRQYNNFRLRNVTKMSQEIMEQFAEIDKTVRERNLFKTDMEAMFKSELDMYEKYKNNPTPSMLDKIMGRIADYTMLGTGGAALFSNVIGWQPAMVGGGLLGLQQGSKMGARSAVKPTGSIHNMLLKNQTPFELQAITDRMKQMKDAGIGEAGVVGKDIREPWQMTKEEYNKNKFLHGTGEQFEEFKIGAKGYGHGVLYFSEGTPSRPGAKIQAEAIANGPFGGRLITAEIDTAKSKRFDPMNDPKAAAIMKEAGVEPSFKRNDGTTTYVDYVEYPDMGVVAPKAIEAGYQLFRVHEPSVQGFSWAISDTSKINIVQTHKEAVKQAFSEGKPVPPEVLKNYPLNEWITKGYRGKPSLSLKKKK